MQYTKTYTMHVTPQDWDTGQTRVVTLNITPPDISIMSQFDHTRQGLEVEIISIVPPCGVTDEIEEDMYSYVKEDLVNH